MKILKSIPSVATKLVSDLCYKLDHELASPKTLEALK